MHNMMCCILVIGESSSNLGGIKFKSLKVYLFWNKNMLLGYHHFAFKNMLRSDNTPVQRKK